ncbi:endonuclease V-like isoform X1 [Octopus vulgaris]|uniref:Endonuclease V-like isoform X1 n=2 Tax=Octopus TaxID=6643 RepID=A0AA36BJF2_OCTVU|nr:endonuclease V-like isoform X1 [Octopus sinensis]CAI9734567.1 endonuclease V-like isoform X1 [Octopus vulgaris]
MELAIAGIMLISYAIKVRLKSNSYKTIIRQLIREEDLLREKLILEDDKIFQEIKENKDGTYYIGGVDVSFQDDGKACIALAVLTFPELEVVYTKYKHFDNLLEYIPSFLAFREGPCVKSLFNDMKKENLPFFPHVLMIDGNGILHPRDLGLACHVGIDLDIPSIGVAKSLFYCHGIQKDSSFYEKVQNMKDGGDSFPLVRELDNKTIAYALKSTKDSKKPIYISQGYKVSLSTAVWLVKQCCKYRIPEPVRMADQYSRKIIRESQTS